ncbi:MAG: protein kinase [Candidatus Aminicenantes bacterium]|nr:protein kinase [Candidatus Aminicenantes bacterium]
MRNIKRKGKWVLLILTFLFGVILSTRDIVDSEVEKSIVLNKLVNESVEKKWDDKQKEKALASAGQALEYAKEFDQKDQEVYALANLGNIYRRLKQYDKAMEYAQKSLELAEKRKNKKEIVYALDVIGIIYTEIPDFQKALRVFERMRPIYTGIGDTENEAKIVSFISNVYSIIGEKERGLELKKEALRLYRDVGDYDQIAHTLADIGAFYSLTGDTEKAQSYYLDAVKIAEEKGTASRRGRINQRLGMFYKGLKQYRKSADYFRKTINIYKTNNRTKKLPVPYTLLGDILIEQKKYDQALFYLNRALDIKLTHKFSIYSNPAPILDKIGQVFFKKKEYQKAIDKYKEALNFYIKGQNINRQIESHHSIGEVYLVLTDLKNANKNLKKSSELLKKSYNISLKRDNYKLLSGYFEKTGNYKKALEYHRWYADLNLKIYDSESVKTITEMQTKYGTEKKEKEIELLKKKEEIRELTLSKQKTLRNLFLAGFVLLLVVMVFFVKKYYYFFTFWKKKNVISHYKVVDKIGSGGMGIVYKAHDVRDKTKTFAIKVLREEYFDDETYKKRFKQEALVTDRLDHPNIIKISERGESGGNLYMAMELLKGRTLEQKLREQGRLKLDEAIHIMTQVSDALVRIHGKNIIHRDMKPANIMLIEKDGDENYVKVLDFGLARAEFQTRLTRTGIMVGTTNYLSPEQITNSGISTASDIFSSGIIFYEMVCGSKPFFGESESDIIRAILDTQPVAPGTFSPDIPEKLDELIIRMLAKDKKSRPTGKGILKTLQTID